MFSYYYYFHYRILTNGLKFEPIDLKLEGQTPQTQVDPGLDVVEI